ncbi:MAG: hypothetical protein ACFCU2_04275 [Acidimicrobiia bacterium]
MRVTNDTVREAFESLEFELEIDTIVERAVARRKRVRTLQSTIVGSVLIGVIAMAFLARSPEALAYWDPVPSTPDDVLLEAAPDLCAAQLESVGPLMPLLLVDQRANAARAVFGERGSDANGPVVGFSICSLVKADGQWTAPQTEDLPFSASTFAGVTDEPNAAKVILYQSDGTQVEAAMKDGFYHFWWIDPESYEGGRVEVLDSEGNVLSELTAPPLPAP